jgi:carboxypeptidase family protein/TonB-dependent receptor-like protein
MALALPAYAQIESGTFTGTVADPSGAFIPGAVVTITNQATNIVNNFQTDASGVYRIGSLPPGLYTIKVEAKGFKSAVDRNLELTVGIVQRVDFRMELGAAVEAITVEASAPLVNTEEGRLSSLVGASEVSNLPLNGRSVYRLMQLAPGAVNVSGVMFEGGPNTVVNGVRQNFNGFWLDGVANKGLSGGIVTLPNLDIVQEFRISTLNMSAEYGNSAGSVTTIVTKSGTNEFHGTAYEYLRNSALDANEFFRNLYGCELGVDPFCHGPDQGNGRGSLDKNPLRFNQFGFTLGGPIRRDKTFFFGSYQGDRTRTFAPAFPITLESPQWRQAVTDTLPNSVAALLYSNFPGPNGFVLNTVDQYVGDNYGGFGTLVCPDYLGPVSPTDFQNAARITSNFQKLFGVTQEEAADCPTTIQVGQSAAQATNRTLPFQLNAIALLPTQASQDWLLYQGNQWSARIDHNVGDGDRLFGRFIWQKQTDQFGLPGTPPATSLRGFAPPFTGLFPNLGISWTHTFSPTVINEVRAGYARNSYDQSVKLAPGVPEVDFDSGDLGFGSYQGYPSYFRENIYTYSDLVNIVKGKHGVKAGVEFRRNIENSDFNMARPGYVFFDPIFFGADAPYDQVAGVDPGIVSNSPARLSNNVRSWRNLEMGIFIQDDWKVTPHLTLNLGLRYDLYTRHTEKYGQVTQFILGPGANITEQVRNTNTAAGLPGCDTPEQVRLAQLAGVCGPGGFAKAKVLGPGDHNNFGPRVGFAWSPLNSDRMSVRGGFGVSYEGTLYNQLSNSRWNLPFYSFNESGNFLSGDVNNVVYGPSVTDASGNIVFDPNQKPTFNGSATNPGQGVGAQAVGNLVGWDANNPNLAATTAIVDPAGMRDPYVYSFFFGVQQQVSRNTMLEVNYVGSAGHKLFRAADMNNVRGGRLPIPGMCLNVQGETVCSNRDTAINPVTGDFVNPVGSVNPNFGSLRVWENAVNSNYNSLQVSATHRGRHGLTMAAYYTWGHSMDEGSDWHSGGTSINGFAAGDAYNMDVAHPELDRGHSTFDFRHRFTFNQVWELPWRQDQRGLLGHLLGGWQFNSIWMLQSGAHWTAFQRGPRDLRCSGGTEDGSFANGAGGASACLAGGGSIINVGGDFNLNGINNDRPDPVGSNTIHATKEQWVHGFFDGKDAYEGGFIRAPCLACNGTLGRNTLVGPGLFQTDLSVFKKIPIRERLALQFRAEFFNAFNRANFHPPWPQQHWVDNPLFGQAAGTFDPREIQLALKMIW